MILHTSLLHFLRAVVPFSHSKYVSYCHVTMSFVVTSKWLIMIQASTSICCYEYSYTCIIKRRQYPCTLSRAFETIHVSGAYYNN